MFNVRSIISNNNATFYDFNNHRRISQKRRAVLTCLCALMATALWPEISDGVLSGFLAVQSIILGFTFNVMFFLLGNREKMHETYSSVEDELRAERLNTLYLEVFHNISYFNLLSVLSIVVALLLLFPVPVFPDWIGQYPEILDVLHGIVSYKPVIVISRVARACVSLIFYIVAIEAAYSIARIIGRTSFYFEQKVQQSSSDG